ncbi:hypothetical protein TNIN_412791 [Trichonephila inaurata madagascariensis]|uniref:Uncharacterized protein n=1 Tax=Trichonephila inaurata madagascariensis TaxID=2747483 RepID=A0A8X6WYP7_9ARAC|nr:hypothetical protein TNIN_412791 [Trichonephila inaurata madagascariensis]
MTNLFVLEMYLQHKNTQVCYLHKFPQQRRATIQSSSGDIDDYFGKIPYRSARSVGEMTSGPPDHLPIHQCPLKKSSVRTVSRPFKGSFWRPWSPDYIGPILLCILSAAGSRGR